jgi:hypothetical protein
VGGRESDFRLAAFSHKYNPEGRWRDYSRGPASTRGQVFQR